uniref:Non-specific serine/threonine protein kinase n=1 Tax=Strongyloides papillosus TaxID=174720 RepID=A0A0N5C565_STREA
MNSPFRGLKRSGNQSYPYPRTHTPVMVFRNNVRSVVVQNSPDSSPNSLSRITFMSTDEIKKNYVPKRRPPLNWAIPTIPESLSDESLKSILSHRNDEMGNLIIDKDIKHINVQRLVEIMDKNVISSEGIDGRQSELNEFDKKNNNFVDKFKIRKYWKKHQKNKSFEERDEKDKGHTQIPRLKMKNILRMNGKEKDNSEKHDTSIDGNEEITFKKMENINSNCIRGKSPLITMAQKFRLRNGKSKGFKEKSSTNVNGSTSMDFMKSFLPTNFNQYTESLKRSQSLEAKTGIYYPLELSVFDRHKNPNLMNNPIYNNISGQINEIYNKNTTHQKNATPKVIEESSLNGDYLCIYSTGEEECKVIKKEILEDNNVSTKGEDKSSKVDENSENCEVNDDKTCNQEEIEEDSQTSVQKQNNKLTFKSFFNSKIIKSGKTKMVDEKVGEVNDSSNNLNVSDNKTTSLAELESKLFLQNPLNRPLAIPSNFGKSFNDDGDINMSDERLLRCTETYAPMYFQIQKAIGEGDNNDDDLCPLRIPKESFSKEKLPVILKEKYCKPFIQNEDEPPESIRKCKEFDDYCVETIKKQLFEYIITEKNIKEKDKILDEAISVIKNDEYLLESVKNMLLSHFNETTDILDINVCEDNSNKDEKNDKIVVGDELSIKCIDDSKEELHDSNIKLSNDAVSFASINLLTSTSSDIVIATSPEEFENAQDDLNCKKCCLSPHKNNINEDNKLPNYSSMIHESTVIDNISPPKFIKSTYIPMIEDAIEDEFDVIEDKICKSGDGFKLDIQFCSKAPQNNNKESRKIDTPKHLSNLSPYDNASVGKSSFTPVKLKTISGLRKPSKQFFTFFSKGKKKHKKIQETLNEDKIKKAPLAQSECTRIANSPMVETPPISLFQKNSKTITEDVISGVPAVVNEEEYLTPKTPRSRANADSSAGLIDDELNDQPMLIGNSYSMNNLGSLTSFQIDHFEVEDEYQGELMCQSLNGLTSNSNNNNELCVIRNKGMAKSITDALIANNLKDELTPETSLLSSGNINSNEKGSFQCVGKSQIVTDDEKSDNSFNSSKENQAINKNNNEEHILKCTENEETKIDIKLVEFENQPLDFSIYSYQQKLPFSNKEYESTNSFNIIKQLKQENKKLQDVIKKKDEEIRLLKEKLSIFINL